MTQHGHHHDHPPTLEEMRKALTAEFWDERYGGSERVWSGRPNQRLVEQVADLEPGYALEVGCGEGADAIWLARRGWQVTAVDVSTVALDRTAEHAVQAGVADRVDVGVYDALGGHPPHVRRRRQGYDLVSVHFLHVPREDFDGVYQRIAAAVAPGGRLLVVAHHPHDVDSGARESHGPGLMFEPDQVVAALDPSAWEVEVSDSPTREQLIDGEPATVRDTVVRLRRKA